MDRGERSQVQRMKDPAEGTLQVVALSSAPEYGAMATGVRLAGVLRVPGLEPTAVQYVGGVRTLKWPQTGQLLPVVVDRADPAGEGAVVVDWARVPTQLQRAEDLAQRLRDQGDSENPPGVGHSDGI